MFHFTFRLWSFIRSTFIVVFKEHFKHMPTDDAYYSTVFLVRHNVGFKTQLNQGCLGFSEWFGTVIANVESTRPLF